MAVQSFSTASKSSTSVLRNEDVLSSPGVLVPSAASLRIEAGRDLPQSSLNHPTATVNVVASHREVNPPLLLPPTGLLNGSTPMTSDNPQDPALFAGLHENMLRHHTGIVDQAALTTSAPTVVMMNVVKALTELGIEYKKDGDARLRCMHLRRDDQTESIHNTPAGSVSSKLVNNIDGFNELSVSIICMLKLLRWLRLNPLLLQLSGLSARDDRGIPQSSSLRTLLSRRSSSQSHPHGGPGRLSTPLMDVAQAIVNGGTSMLSPRKGEDGRGL
jgi:hypothetical protein